MGNGPEPPPGHALISVPRRWLTARPDWAARIVARQSLLPDLPIDQERADRALRIFKRLRLVEVAGQPTMGQACEQWVFDWVAVIFGAYDSATKRRVIREFLLLVAKKNTKSSIAAAVMLTALILHDRHAAEYLILAPTKDVADNSFLPAYRMVKADKALLKVYKPSESTRAITNVLDGANLEVKSADAEVVGGQKAQCVFVDELWLFGKKAAAKNILSEAVGSLASQTDGFVIYASTQSDDPPAGVFKEKLDYHRDIRDGVIEDHTALPLIYEYPKAMEAAEVWKDRKTWYIPNPNLGRSVDIDFIAGEMLKAERAGQDSVRLIAAKHLNVQVGNTLRGNRWPGAEFWTRGEDPTITLDALLERCEVVVTGIDGGGLDDLFGLTVLGRCRETKVWLSWSHAWAHTSVLERRQSIATVLRDFEAAGELTIVDDELGDISAIIEIIAAIKARDVLAAVAVDPAGLGEFIDALAEIDITIENKLLIGAPQGWALMNAIKTAERKLANGTLKVAPSALMRWCVGNLKIEPTATGIRATKQNAGDAKIDPVMALFDAVTVMALNPQAARKPLHQLIII